MSTFLSYTRKDEDRGRQLADDLRRMSRTVWLDNQIYGGTQWWREIIEQITGAEIFLFALSDHSMASQPCREELKYAQQLNLPIIPVQVGEVTNMRIPLAGLQIVDYRNRDADAVIELIAAVTRLTQLPRDVPDPLPVPPEVPFAYLYRLARELEKPVIAPDDQERLIADMQRALTKEEDPVARNDVRILLGILRDRREITVLNAEQIDGILGEPERPGMPVATGGATWLTADILDKHRPKPGSDGGGTGGSTADWPTALIEDGPATAPAGGTDGAGVLPDWLRDRVLGAGTRPPNTGTPRPGTTTAGPATGTTATGTTATGRGWAPSPPAPNPPPNPGTGGASAGTAGVAWEHAAPTGPPPRASQPPPAPPGSWAGGPATPDPGRTAPRWLGAAIGAGGTRPGARSEPAEGAAPPPDAGPPGRYAFAGAALGSAGIPLLLLGPLRMLGPSPLAGVAVTALLVVAITGIVLAFVATSRRQPGGRPAVALAVLGLAGVIVLAVVTGSGG